MPLRAYARDFGLKATSCRFFTVYGERGVENHAVIAMIARAFVRQNPFEVWGDGTQIRNWTYVGDIVRGMALCAEKIDDGTAVNLGTEERTRVIDAVREVLRYTGRGAQPRGEQPPRPRAPGLGAADEVHGRPPSHDRLVFLLPAARGGERVSAGDADRAVRGPHPLTPSPIPSLPPGEGEKYIPLKEVSPSP